MNIVSNGIFIKCTDKDGTYEIFAKSFDELIDEITICSEFKNENLNRGWIGNIEYITSINKSFETDEANSYSDNWKDVLLTTIRLTYSSDAINTWEYRFLKK